MSAPERAIVYPLGHPVELTAPPSIVEIARERWPEQARFDVLPLKFDVKITGVHCGPAEFTPRADGFGVGDMFGNAGDFCTRSRTGWLSASEAGMKALLELLVLTALDWTFFIGIHAACVTRNGRSVLLCGDSYAGKSTLAYACSRSGWTFVSDNALHWAPAPWKVLVSGSSSLRLRDGSKEMFGLDTGEIEPQVRASAALPGPCIFLKRRTGPAVFSPYSERDAMRYLAEYDTRPDREYAEASYRELLLPGVSTLEYENVEDAVRLLETL